MYGRLLMLVVLLVKCRKAGAANWGNSKKEVAEGTTQKFKSAVIDKAVKIAKSMGGNMTAAVKKIEKIEKNLSKNGRVEYALQQANEGLGDKFSKRLSKYNKKKVKKSRDAMKKYAKVKKVKLRGKSGMGKISHLGMESVDEAKPFYFGGAKHMIFLKKSKMYFDPTNQNLWLGGPGGGPDFSDEPIEPKDSCEIIKEL